MIVSSRPAWAQKKKNLENKIHLHSILAKTNILKENGLEDRDYNFG
jgi:hypothetical protein